MKIQILDIDENSAFDIDKEIATGTDGVIIKGGQGSYVANFKPAVKKCVDREWPYGIYWVPDARYHPDKAKTAIKRTFEHGDFGPLGLWFDCEKPLVKMPDWVYNKLPYRGWHPIYDLAQFILKQYNFFPNTYTSPGAFKLIFGNCPVVILEEFARGKLWTAQYHDGLTNPDLYGAWMKWLLWQYQEGPDYSVFNGDELAFNAWVDGYEKPADNLPHETEMGAEVKVSVRLRELPSITAPKIKTLIPGTRLLVDKVEGDWAHVIRTQGNWNVKGWAAIRIPGLTLIKFD